MQDKLVFSWFVCLFHTSDNHPMYTDRGRDPLWPYSLSHSSRQRLSSGVKRSLCSPAHIHHWIHRSLMNERATVCSQTQYLSKAHTHYFQLHQTVSPSIHPKTLTVPGEELPEIYGDHHPFTEIVPVAPQADVHWASAWLAVHATEVERVAGEVIRVPTLPFICWKSLRR